MKESMLVDSRSNDEEKREAEKKQRTRTLTLRYLLKCLFIGVIFLFIFSTIGFIIKEVRRDKKMDDEKTSSEMLMAEIKAENIREYLKNLTSTPHLAGTPADLKQAEQLKAFWEEQGMTLVTITPFNVLLSYPDQNHPNRIKLLDADGDAIFTAQLTEEVLRPDQDQPDVVPPFNAYSATGNPVGNLLYVNYGRLEDFNLLKERGVNFTGCICIARNARLYRGNKADNAQRFGAAGLLIYNDPADSSRSDVVYPRSWWLPDTGVQRGTIIMGRGDPLTPGYPAIKSAYRRHEDDTNLAKIPVHPISYGDALQLMKHLSGDHSPPDWRGGLDIDYNIGPGFNNSRWKVQMSISTHNVMRTTYNVHGVIEGAIEPDRYVLLGNHRDAWVFGATDPSGGTAAVMEVSRAMGVMLKQGWRPRRSIVFCSWGAEEYGLIGSMEWVEYYSRLLFNRAVMYINVDTAVQGTGVLYTRALPLTHNLLYDVAKKIPNPNSTEILHGRATVYDTWLHVTNDRTDGESKKLPPIDLPGSGTDFTPFVALVGVTVADFQYRFNPELDINGYPLYHTAYDSFYYVDTIMDPGFKFHEAVAQLIGETARIVSDSLIIPYDVTDYSHVINQALTVMINKYGSMMTSHGLGSQIEYLRKAMTHFANAAGDFKETLNSIDRNNSLQVRMVNDQLMMLSRAFIDSQGLPGRPDNKNMAFSPSALNRYDGSAFPGLADSLYVSDTTRDNNNSSSEQWQVVKKQLSIVTFIIQSAGDSLRKQSMC